MQATKNKSQNFRFGRNSRLLKRCDFEEVFQAARSKSTGRMIRRSEFVVYIRYSDEGARLGISIPKKIVRRANKRNRMKRCLREYFRHHREDLPGDLIVRWLKAPENMSFEFLTEPLRLVISKRHL